MVLRACRRRYVSVTTRFLSRTSFRSGLIQITASLRIDELALSLRSLLVSLGRSPRMLAVEMHETPERNEPQLRRQLEWVERHFTLVDLPTFAKLWEQSRTDPQALSKTKPPLLFTFDDGRQNNYKVAAPLLESFGTRGVFFVVPQFAQSNSEEAREIYYSRIDIRPTRPEPSEEDTQPMTPQQIADLAHRGHSIGNHTYSHVNLAKLSETRLQHEIVESAQQIRSWSGRPVDAFAWTFSWDSITPAAWNLIQQHHKFCFAPCPGSVDCLADSPNLICRTEVEAVYSPAEYRFMYSGLAGLLWRNKRARLKAMLVGPRNS